MGLGGVSFQTNPPAQKAPPSGDIFNMLGGFDMGGSTQQTAPTNSGFGGDLLGFGASTPPVQQHQHQQPQPVVNQPADNLLGGADLMGFGFSSQPSNPQPQNQGGFNFGVGNQTGFNQPPQQPPQQQNNFGFSLLGNSQPTQQTVQQSPPVTSTQSTIGFQPITNNNPNKILAYDNNHLQIWIDCIKENNETTKLFTTYINKTNNTIN
jgi:hypothetical protein